MIGNPLGLILSSNTGRPAPGPVVLIPVYAVWMYTLQSSMRLIHAEGSGGGSQGGGVLCQNAAFWTDSQSAVRLRSGPSGGGGSLGGPWGDLRGGIPWGGFPQVPQRFWGDSGSIPGRCWNDSGSILRRFWVDSGTIIAVSSAFLPRCRALQDFFCSTPHSQTSWARSRALDRSRGIILGEPSPRVSSRVF
jgi:hypothetical protein